MISVDEARAIVRARASPLPGTERIALAQALGRVLAGPVVADRDDPPFERAMMDGYAVRGDDTRGAPCALRVTGAIAAGDASLPAVRPGEAVWINTGAPLPPGADAVVPVEMTRGKVEILVAVGKGAHVLGRGALARRGETLIDGLLTPEAIGICAAAGADPVAVRRRPRVAVLATGSELDRAPGPHQIRNSNGPTLIALLHSHEVSDLGAVADDPAATARAVRRGLESDLLVTTGGVSKGDHDLVRPALEEAGVEILFHGVALQPGKPVLFGEHAGGRVFGLPGNPASSLVCADLFVLPYLAALAGRAFDEVLSPVRARLTAPVEASPKRRRVFPCALRGGRVEPLPWRSSADLYSLARGNAYLVIEPGVPLAEGDEVTCLLPERAAARALGR